MAGTARREWTRSGGERARCCEFLAVALLAAVVVPAAAFAQAVHAQPVATAPTAEALLAVRDFAKRPYEERIIRSITLARFGQSEFRLSLSKEGGGRSRDPGRRIGVGGVDAVMFEYRYSFGD